MDSLLLEYAMTAVNNVKAQRDRLLHLQRRLQGIQAATPAPAAAQDRDAKLGVLATDLFKVYYVGLEYGARTLATCARLARQEGVRFTPPSMAFAVMNNEQLHDALLAHQLPPRPTTQAQAIDRVMAALLAVKLLEEHLLPRFVECLVGGPAPVPGKAHDPDATAKSGSSKPPDREAASGGGGGEVDKALDYMYRANRITNLAVKHMDVAVAVLSRFLDPEKVASITEYCDEHVYISEEGGTLSNIRLTTSPRRSRGSFLCIADRIIHALLLIISLLV